MNSLEYALAEARKELADQAIRADAAERVVADAKDKYDRALAEERRRTEAVAQSSKSIKETLHKALVSEKAASEASLANARTLSDIAKDKAQREFTTLAAKLHDRERELETMKQGMATKLAALRKEITEVRKAKEVEVETAKKEAATAKEQINKVRDEMRKAKGM
jgi:hypothetical protein